MEINNYIDSTNLSNLATKNDIKKLCLDAIKYKFYSVCVNPYYIEYAKELLKNSNVLITTVIGFPLGMNTVETKEFEAINAVTLGADEIDMVANIGAIKNNDFDYVKEEIEYIRDAIDGKTLKVIIETSLLEDEEIIKMVNICNEAFINFVKTSTGYFGKASVEAVELMNKYKGEVLEIKASGGIKDIETFEKMIKAGATRIGTSSGEKLMHDDCEGDHCDCCK